jgi:lipid II:glycine glycyltransferase (peptidoglycan interpeptide bridge formation enzyme)
MSQYQVQLITHQKVWEDFILTQPGANFLQSWQWGVFQAHLGKKVYRLGLLTKKGVLGGAEVVVEKAKRGNYLTVAGGPLVDWENKREIETINKALKEIAREEHCAFIRMRPQIKDSQELRLLVKKIGLKKAPMHLTADLTLQLDLSKSPEELLLNMRKSTRYEIRRADKMGVKVKLSEDPRDLEIFYATQLRVAKKQHFVPFTKEFLDEQFKAFLTEHRVALLHTYTTDNKLLASAFIIFYNGEAAYHYGVSTELNTKLPGSYAVLWAAILEAKKRGMLRFNFWGISPVGEKQHRFAGVSLFKRGFGGEEVAYLPTHDLPINWRYWVTWAFEILRKKIRRL